ncbi:MAG: cyclic GMP-AMP synthase DncV-like nucleotidyltransferase [Bacteroidia bacterium]
MLPLLALILGVAGIGTLIAKFSSSGEPEFKITQESNCSGEFLKFEKDASLSYSKHQKLIEVRRVIEKKIRAFFSQKLGVTFSGFYIQGSYKHDTIVRNPEDTCDVDLGIYFDGKPSITPRTIQTNIVKIFSGHTSQRAMRKNKCVRIYYANQFHIDVPIYYWNSRTKKYYLGVGTTNRWEPSDPRLFTEWVKQQTRDNTQKKRLIKYFKAWAATYKKRKGQKMPSGLAFTIWAIQFYKEDAREDLAFIKTANQLYTHLKAEWKCEMPVLPHDNVVDDLNKGQKENFLKALAELLNSSEKICASKSKIECVEAWRYLLGKWFPEKPLM